MRLHLAALFAVALLVCLHASPAVAGVDSRTGCTPKLRTLAGERVTTTSGRVSAGPVALEPEELFVTTRGVTLSARSSDLAVRPGQRIVVRGKVSIERGAPFPFRVLVVAHPAGSAHRSAHAIAYVRMDGSYIASIRPRWTSELKVIALPLKAGQHLAEAPLGTISVRGHACGHL